MEQYSTVSAERLKGAAERLAAAIGAYAADAAGMRGGTSEMAALFQRNEALEAIVKAFAEAAFDHTGTFPFVLGGDYDEDEDEDYDGEDNPDPVAVLSVVSRWDVGVLDRDRLLEAGRAAHRRNRPDETDDDAAVAVWNEGGALYAILHEHGEPWFNIPGLDVVWGARAYVQPSTPQEPYDGEPDNLVGALFPPDGTVLVGESW